MMKTTQEELRGRISEAPRNRRGYVRCDRALVQDVLRYLDERALAGMKIKQVGRELGLNPGTLWGWAREGVRGKSKKRKRVMRPVKVSPTTTTNVTLAHGPVIVLPCGVRIERIGIEDAVAITKALV